VRLVFWHPDEIDGCPDGFQWLQEQLTRWFGPPETSWDNGEAGEALWQVGKVTLRQEYFNGMGGGHYVFLFLRDQPAE
jgi:hypothetical protein